MCFIDLQTNGYAGVDFNGDRLSAEQLQCVYEKLQTAGVRAVLPTIITDELSRMARRLSALRELIDQDRAWRRMFPAFHIEGPCISPEDGYRGAHPVEHVRPAGHDVFEPLVEACGGVERLAIVTLAPEVDKDLSIIRWLTERGVLVSAGHTDAPLEVLREAEQAGLRLFTHLSNGCKSVIPRHNNIINRALALEKIIYTFIPDGHHIPFFVLKGWLKQVGVDRSIFVTDCMAAAAAPPGIFRVGPWEVEVGQDRLVHPPGQDHLAGSALTMPEAYANAIEQLGLTDDQALGLCAGQSAALIAKWLI